MFHKVQKNTLFPKIVWIESRWQMESKTVVIFIKPSYSFSPVSLWTNVSCHFNFHENLTISKYLQQVFKNMCSSIKYRYSVCVHARALRFLNSGGKLMFTCYIWSIPQLHTEEYLFICFVYTCFWFGFIEQLDLLQHLLLLNHPSTKHWIFKL